MKTMQEINQEKWKRMRTIIKKLMENPLTYQEIVNLFGNVDRNFERSLRNYLLELKELELVSLVDGYYHWYNSITVFASKHDLELAVEHSKSLFKDFFINVETGMGDYEAAVNALAKEPDDDLPTAPNFLKAHLRSYPSFWHNLQKYRELLEKYNFEAHVGVFGLKSLRALTPTTTAVTANVVYKGMIFIRDDEERASFQENELLRHIPVGNEMEKDFQELIRLKEELVKNLLLVIEQLRHGIPLKGYCDCCPKKALTIKD